jgi:hypothetical protein
MRYASILVVVLTPVFCLTSCVNNIEALDPCNTVNCANGADCNQANCICTKRYTGPECREEKTPKAMTVTEMIVTDYRLKSLTNEEWDPSLSGPSSGPDLYLIMNRNNAKLYTSDTLANQKGNTIDWNKRLPIKLGHPDRKHRIVFYDHDPSGEDELMGKLPFKPYRKHARFPNTIYIPPTNLKETGDGFRIKLQVEYTF